MSVVGVVGDTVQSSFEGQAIPEMFYPYANASEELPVAVMSLVVRTRVEPMSIASGVRDEIRRIDPALPLSNVMTTRMLADKALSKPRLNLLLLGIFAVVALVLAAVGIYGVMSYVVTQRTHEIGVRMALGAQGRHVLLLVIGQGVRLMLVGGIVGLLAAFMLTRLLISLLYGVSNTDALTFLSALVLLTAIGLLACYFPARRAMSLDPATALRYE